MIKLDIESASYDLIIHSDTLEHVEYPVTALSECKRILAQKGRTIFTVPIVVDRLTKYRIGLPKSYHGSPSNLKDDLVVYTEFGVDI